MNWARMGLACLVPLLVAGPVAWGLWSRRHYDAGKVAAVVIVLTLSLVFSAIEYVDCDRLRIACLNDVESACLALARGPEDVVKVGAYGVVGMVQVMLVFVGADVAERRSRNAHVDPAWQR